jgi:hypothetical protein
LVSGRSNNNEDEWLRSFTIAAWTSLGVAMILDAVDTTHDGLRS